MKKTSFKKAFTLVELMVVIAIIAILTAIVMSNLTQSKAKARDAKRVSDLAQIQLALELFFDRCNEYPPNITNISYPCPTNSTVILSNFISKVPTDNGTPYIYGVKTSPYLDYILMTTLETNSSVLTDSYSAPATSWNVGGTMVNVDCTSANRKYCVVPK